MNLAENTLFKTPEEYEEFVSDVEKVLTEEALPRFKNWIRTDNPNEQIVFRFFDGYVPFGRDEKGNMLYDEWDKVTLPKGVHIVPTHKGVQVVFTHTNETSFVDSWNILDFKEQTEIVDAYFRLLDASREAEQAEKEANS